MKLLKTISLSLLLMVSTVTFAQELDANLQLRPRYEYKNGFGSLMPNGDYAASFISQRSRLNLNFKQDKLKMKLTLQNVRTWGDVNTKPVADKNGVALFEAFAQYDITDKWSARAGRQVISYDNQRIFGEIDWAQQGQSHDAIVFSYHKDKNQLDLGAAINANDESAKAAAYTTAGMYKEMQYAWYHTQISKLNVSVLLLNTGYQFGATPALLNVDYKQTFGTHLSYKNEKWNNSFWVYGQTGNSNNMGVSAFNAAGNIGYSFSKDFNATLGYEYLSGKNQDDTSTKIKSFTPLFGTNHGFNGLMDYFYVGNHLNSVGLQDAFLKLSLTQNKWQFNLIPHIFSAPATVLDANNVKMNSNLGTEIDFTTSYAVQKDVSISGGYSQMFASSTLERLKVVGNPTNTNNWAWIMININPRIFSTILPTAAAK